MKEIYQKKLKQKKKKLPNALLNFNCTITNLPT